MRPAQGRPLWPPDPGSLLTHCIYNAAMPWSHAFLFGACRGKVALSSLRPAAPERSTFATKPKDGPSACPGKSSPRESGGVHRFSDKDMRHRKRS
jgi:hypothetical protein